MGPGTTCPVCLLADPVGAHCPECGWVLSAGPWAGVPSPARAESYATAFARACRRWDLAVAARAAGYPGAGEPDRLDRMLAYVRGPRPEHGDVVAAVEALTVEGVEAIDDVITPVLLSGAVVVDIHPAGVTLVRLGVDDLGRPRVSTSDYLDWHSLGLPADEDRARFDLAGGTSVVTLPEWPEDAVVLNRLAGWLGIDLPGAHLISGDEPAVDDDLVSALARGVPQRHGCGLILVDVAANGRTSVVVHPLFPAGATALDSPEAVVRIAAPPQDDPLLLAVVAGPAGTPPWHRTLVRTAMVELAPNEKHTVRFRLTGPGTVEITSPDTEAVEVDCLADVVKQVPTRYRRRDSAADLAVAVELGGAAFAKRQELALALFDSIERGHPAPSSVRVAVLAYSDHKGRAPQQVLTVHEFSGLVAARGFVAGLHAAPLTDSVAAPVEDALWAAASLPWRSVARTLVLLGSRPPHSAEHGCPNGHRWDDLARRLERDEVHRVVVWDQFGDEPIPAVWSALSRPHTPLRADWVAADRLAADARALGRAGAATALPFPLTRLPQQETR
ncbi:hypothetical protein [Actinokineospora globicatena]|uniref:Uncharacterized protein n=1 Tax=Actinokineospora globicatena TaxID=103729 RepID=A0A9W6QQ31_9PSEU|nr:hypothetical protein [Actinokineospora globicatena]GLW92725.1 hypothetical protein Aglo03_35410 [Actinokineospora globicatena]